MIIKSIRVQNFRCLKDVTLFCDPLTVLVGRNGAGKSCLLQALQLFYEPNANYDESDFYANNTEEPISVTITFKNLTSNEKELFRPYIFGNTLTIEKVLMYPPSGRNQKYFGWKLRNPDFEPFRQAKGRSGLSDAYRELKKNKKYRSFPPYTNKEKIETILTEWEESHPDQCEKSKDEGQFFGFKEVGESRLERFTKFILVPAVQDAAEEASETRGSIIKKILDLVVRNTLQSKPEFVKLRESIKEEYGDILNPNKIPELQELAKQLTSTLKSFVPDAEVGLSWEPRLDIDLPLPPACIRLLEDGYPSPVNRTGHGLQRAFILTMLQHLAYAQATQLTGKEKEELSMPNLIIGIEEPELFQHPDRQRHFAKTLLKLSEGRIEGVSENIQIIYCTHSPLLIDIERFDQIRIFRKVDVNEKLPKQTMITYTTLDDVAKMLERACEESENTFTGETFRQRLHAIMTPQMNEGFFSKLVVLVEGVRDKALILGTALALGYDFESMGISVINCNGKHNIDKPFVIFKSLGIPVFAIWDSDFDKEKDREKTIKFNREMCRLCEYSVEDYPHVISKDFACIKTNLEKTFREEIGLELFNRALQKYCREHGLGKGKYAIENPTTISALVTRFHGLKVKSKTVEDIVEKIMAKISEII